MIPFLIGPLRRTCFCATQTRPTAQSGSYTNLTTASLSPGRFAKPRPEVSGQLGGLISPSSLWLKHFAVPKDPPTLWVDHQINCRIRRGEPKTVANGLADLLVDTQAAVVGGVCAGRKAKLGEITRIPKHSANIPIATVI
jgi:hypothetical protein